MITAMKLIFCFLTGLLLVSCGNIQPVDPPPIAQVPSGYLYKVEPGIPGKSVYVCGERPFDATGKLIGPGDLNLQTKQVFENIKTVLKTVNMTMDNVTQITYSIKSESGGGAPVKVDPAMAQQVNNVAASYFVTPPQLSETKAVTQTVRDDVLVEIEVVTVK